MPFKPGQSGNPGGRVKDRFVTAALMAQLKEARGSKLFAICRSLIAKAEEGDVQAIREIFDRVEGKPAQTILGDKENPLSINAIIVPSKNATEHHLETDATPGRIPFGG